MLFDHADKPVRTSFSEFNRFATELTIRGRADSPDAAARALHCTSLSRPSPFSPCPTAIISKVTLRRTIDYKSSKPCPVHSRPDDSGVPLAMALVMTALYSVQRAGLAAEVADDVHRILGRPATYLASYLERERARWLV